MKLQELITKLQELETARPGLDMFFQHARHQGDLSFSGSPLHFLDVGTENGQGKCMMTLGDDPSHARVYQEYLKVRDERNRQFPVH